MTNQYCFESDEINIFRTFEKRYRRKPLSLTRKERRRQKRAESDDQRFSDVIDLRSLDSRPQWSSFIQKRKIPSKVQRQYISGDRAQMFAVKDHPGLYVIKDALSYQQQLMWLKRALLKYSLGPYTNLWSHGENIAPLWQNAMETLDLNSFWKLRWANIGRHYDWTARQYVDADLISSLDDDLVHLYQEAVSLSGLFAIGSAQAGIVNFYPSGSSMGGHLDNAEADMISPIVSLSLGCSCIYLQGGRTRSVPPLPIWLNSGDILIMGGPARSCFHGVPLVTSETLPEELKSLLELEHPIFLEYLSHARVNINLRSVDLR